MSLQIWLPFNKNLDNKGFYELPTLSSNTFSVEGNGKIGKCYKGSGIYHLLNDDLIGNQWSVCMWTKLGSVGVYNNILFCKNDTLSTSCHIYFSVINNTYINLGINGDSSAHAGSYAYTFDTTKWYHLAATYDGLKWCIYINGELFKTGTTSAAKIDNLNNIGIGCRSTNNAGTSQTGQGSDRCYNDFRLYNNALSKKEIKEIAKGLILHYPLADKYIENTTNLKTTEDCLSATCYNGAISKYNYGTNTDMYKEVTTFQGKKGTKVYNQTNGTGMYPYVYISNMYTSDGTNSPAYKTLSFDYYTTISTSICPYKLGSGNGTATYIVTNNETKTGTGTNQVVIPVKPNMWNHIEVTFHGTTEADAQWGYIQNRPSHTSDTSNFWFFANMQLEEKDHATGYVGVGGSRTVDTIYDTSGFENNGIPNNISYSSDAKKYDGSSIFNGTNSYIKVANNTWMPQYTEELTVSIWGYASNWASITSGRLWSCTETGGFNIEAGASGYWRFPVYCATNAEHTSHSYKYDNNGLQIADLSSGWHMFTWVFTTTVHSIYVDGELYSESQQTNYGLKFNTNARLFLGCEANTASASSPYFNGKLSDFRIYATALSADQILELYQVPSSADKNNNFYAYSYDEVNQGNEIEYLYNLLKGSGTGTFTQDENGLHLSQGIWVYHTFIPINPTNKTYKYDIELSCDAGNLFYIGWERFDADKTSRANDACVYAYASSAERSHYRIRGIINLSTDGVNPCAFIRLRILNKWTGSASDTNGTAIIHYLSLKEYTNTTTQNMTPLNITKQGIANTTEILEKDIGVSISDVYELNSNEFYEY